MFKLLCKVIGHRSYFDWYGWWRCKRCKGYFNDMYPRPKQKYDRRTHAAW